jgi:hypothetical protein
MWNKCPRHRDECGSRAPVPSGGKFQFTRQFKTGAVLVRISDNKSSRKIVMTRKISWKSRLAIAACAVLLPAATAFASQGPGGGMGTASSLTQMVMAVIVYGASALIVGTGLIGALCRR